VLLIKPSSPRDVSIKSWSFRRGLAIDVAVICPLAASHLGKAEPCESYAQHQKIDRYADAFVHSDYDFAPVIFETSGALNKEGETVLKARGNHPHGLCRSCLSLAVFKQLPLSKF